jgi:putative ABC transport system ATP-binding protein
MLSAIENVELPMSIAGVPVHEQNTRATRLLETVGLMNRASHRPKQLSMGEQQRVAVARALANGPEVIIADEPTGELDSKTAGEIASLLHEITLKEGRLIIAATHDEKLAELADRVYRIEDGKLGMSSVGVAQT